MSTPQSRRAFLCRAVAGGGFLGCAGVSGLGRWPQVASASAIEQAKAVALHPDIEPIVRLLEETPRDQLIEAVAGRIRDGLVYRDVLAALLLAGVRNVEPRPSVGFKFHAVLVVQSVHLASIAVDKADRWLPIFWALDYFKDSQARDERERGWTMGPVDESLVPRAERARDVFVEAMDRWDESKADAAVAGLARSGRPDDIWELFWRYGARDYRSIGHKAIDVANSHRVLGVIGWQHAEPILRSLAYALLMHENGNPADRDDRADRPWRQNQELAAQIPDGWQRGEPNREGTVELLVTIRDGTEEDATRKVVELLSRGVGPQSVWDALFLAGGELLVRQPGIISLHSVTTTNALHYAYRATRDERTRKLILLQNAAFLPLFRQTMRGRGKVGEFAVDRMELLEVGGADPVDEIFADVGRNPMMAARKTLAYFQGDNPLDAWIEKARQLVILKSTGAHDFKFGCSVLEDAAFVSEPWRANYLASMVFQLQGSGKADNPLVQRTRAAFGK